MVLLYSSRQSTDRRSLALIIQFAGVGEGVLRAIFALDDRVELWDRGTGLYTVRGRALCGGGEKADTLDGLDKPGSSSVGGTYKM